MDTPGLAYAKDTVADLSALEIARENGPLAHRVLLLMRSNRKGDKRMNERLSLPHVERRSIVGQEQLVDVRPDVAKVPDGTIDTIVEWLSAGVVHRSPVVVPKVANRARAEVGLTARGVPIDEWTLSLGPNGLFGIMTARRDTEGPEVALDPDAADEKKSHQRSGTPTIVFLNAGLIDHVGPGRWWVKLARAWAEEGFRVVRFDLPGLGDSPERPGQIGRVVYPPDALSNLMDVLRAVSPDDPSNTVLVGLCSGGYHALEAAISGHVRGVCAVNPVLTIKPSETSADATPELLALEPESGRAASGATKKWARALPAHDFLGPMVERLPGPVWWVLNRTAREAPPARILVKTVETGANVFLIAGALEARWLTRGEGRTIRRLQRTEGFEMVVIPDLEHSLIERRSREIATELLTEHVFSCYGSSSRANRHGPDPHNAAAPSRP